MAASGTMSAALSKATAVRSGSWRNGRSAAPTFSATRNENPNKASISYPAMTASR